jgi:cell wall-associated NlpC family hydrolase
VWHAVKDALGIELDLYTPGNPDVIAKCEWTFQNMSGKYGAVQVPATLDSLQPGDLLFHQASDTPYSVDAVTHVSIYIGDGKIIDSAPGGGVKIRSIAYYSQSDPLVGPAVRFPAR